MLVFLREEFLMLKIYQKESCPYCKTVRARLSALDVSWVAHSAEPGSPAAEVLEKLSGSQQVPFLVDAERGVMMPESDAIVEYLDAHYA
ncbi:MAG: glutathione S-transferase N-terminal domain-containing protein [Rubrobacteraceae bacterium]